MKDVIDITKIVKSKSLLSRLQADVVLAYLKANKNYTSIDMKRIEGCTTVFVNHLILSYNRQHKFNRHKKLIFFNVKNPIVVYKIQEAHFNFFDKKTATSYIKLHDKLVRDVLNS